jgi:HAE1 family hydrophobic/amphiphilic exporter-1
MLPAAIGLGPGVETNRPLSLVVMGGMVSSTLLTLVVVPAVYSLVEGARVREWLARVLAPVLPGRGVRRTRGARL